MPIWGKCDLSLRFAPKLHAIFAFSGRGSKPCPQTWISHAETILLSLNGAEFNYPRTARARLFPRYFAIEKKCAFKYNTRLFHTGKIKMSEIKLIVGLGNPGAKYEGTRHNAGEWLVNELARMYNVSLKDDAKYFGKTAKIATTGGDVWLLVPTTFMNLSGKAVGALANFFRIKPEQIVVAHDELDLPCGVAKIKQGGGHGGHNGLKNIVAALGNNNNFYRIRLGIDHPGSKELVAGYVLSKAAPQDQEKINAAVDEAGRCLEIWFKDGVTKATNRLNSFKA